MRTTYAIVMLICAGVFLVAFGASCPPPRNQIVLEVISDDESLSDSPLPSCIDGFICLNFANNANIPTRMALYRHDGYDDQGIFNDSPSVQCCAVPGDFACPCVCPGADQGDCLLSIDEIFADINLDTIGGAEFVTLAPGSTILKRVRCLETKTVGVALSGIDVDPTEESSDRLGPAYRDEPGLGVGSFECGDTVQFAAEDINDTDINNPDLALVILTIEVSD